jgi:glucosamine--fructose-6-phosphate aminotransferase (isomerizing)
MTYAQGAFRRQLEALPEDFEPVEAMVLRQLHHFSSHGHARWRRVRQVHLVGAGDSLYASQAAAHAFRTRGFSTRAVPAEALLHEWSVPAHVRPEEELVVGVSASGRTERVVEVLERAGALGLLRVAVSGQADSPLVDVADESLVVAVGNLERAPGLRTYQASLIGLLGIAAWLRRAATGQLFACARLLPENVAAHVAQTLTELRAPVQRVAERLVDMQTLMVLGTGPSAGTAGFSAAKIMETNGLLAHAQDLEEWRHVERFVGPRDFPVIVLGPEGATSRRVRSTAATATALGRRCVLIHPVADPASARDAWEALAVPGDVSEELSPVLYHVPVSMLAAELADHTGRPPFRFGAQVTAGPDSP